MFSGILWITSLNSHFAGFQSGTRCRSQSRCLGFGNELPQTGQTLSDGLTIKVSFSFRHLTGWTFILLISLGSRVVTGFFLSPLDEVVLNYVLDSLSTISKNICEAYTHTMMYCLLFEIIA